MEIYLDNSATTMVAPEVREEILPLFTEVYGNPSSLHAKGSEAEQSLRTARKRIADSLGVQEKEIYFTSGGTESNNTALIGAAMAKKRRGRHIITTVFEHPSVGATCDYLEQEGFQVTRLGVDARGLVDPEELRQALREDTVLVSVMMVNNELGSRQPVEALGKLIKDFDPEIIFHVDAIQAYGKFRIRPKRCGIDLLSASGHKTHGPKGIGFLYVNEKVRILPLLHGGEQQKGLRSGTENMPGIVGLGKAAELAYRDLDRETEELYRLKEKLQQGFEALEGVSVNGPRDRDCSAPHIVSATFAGIRSEVLLHSLEDQDIFMSAGSACSSHKREMSASLKAIGLSRDAAGSTLRFSLSRYTTEEEIDTVLRVTGELLQTLRRFTRK